MDSHRIEFAGSQGDMLAARLDMPTDHPRAYALFAHCFTCSKDIAAAARISRELAGRGIAVLRFDFTGLGHSAGEFANTNFSSNVQDVVGAANWLRAEHEAPALLVGHSLGGAAVLAAAAGIPESRAVATIGSPADPAHVAHLLVDVRATIEQHGQAEVAIAGRRFMIRKQFIDDLARHDLDERLAELRKSLLVMHAPGDTIVGIDNATRIFSAAKHPKSFVSLDDADHLLTRSADATYVADLLAAWSSRYLSTHGKRGEPANAANSSTGTMNAARMRRSTAERPMRSVSAATSPSTTAYRAT
jgi:alpha/beta superfamily hydrolase